MAKVQLRAGHVQPIWAGHPWVYAQAIEKIEGNVAAGDEVEVFDPRGQSLGVGFYTPGSAIPVRILSRQKRPLDLDFFVERLKEAKSLREALGLAASDTDGYRAVHAEGDRLPGLIVDVFGEAIAMQLLTIGMFNRRALILEALQMVYAPKTILDRTPPNAALLESFTPIHGVAWGEPIDALRFRERGFQYEIPVELGQKTGFYFDQRPLRARIEALAAGRDVLDAYGFVGPIALHAARGVANTVRVVENNPLAVEVGKKLAETNGYDRVVRYEKGDAKAVLAESKGRYDLVIVDPPRLAPTKKKLRSALDGYTQIAALALGATKPGGLTVVCSCSAAVDLTSLSRAVATGAAQANVDAVMLERHFQGPDHPVLSAHPEGLYLKSLILRVGPR
jgi:23S rRNA (cytosine1962-C5)-methyltransferase